MRPNPSRQQQAMQQGAPDRSPGGLDVGNPSCPRQVPREVERLHVGGSGLSWAKPGTRLHRLVPGLSGWGSPGGAVWLSTDATPSPKGPSPGHRANVPPRTCHQAGVPRRCAAPAPPPPTPLLAGKPEAGEIPPK